MKRLLTLLVIASCLTAVGQVPDYVPTEGLVAWYPFNDNANDESGNEHHANLNFDAVLSDDRFGLPNASVFLDGQQDHVSTPAIFNSGVDRTISLWFELLNVDDVTNTIWNTDPHRIESIGWNTYFLDEPGISYCLGDSTDWLSCANGGTPETYFDVAFDMSGWKHLVSVKEGLDWRFYIDGSMVHDSVIAFNTIDQTVPLLFGAISCCGAGGYGEEFTGSIDDIGIWNRAITEEEVFTLYNAAGPIAGCTDVDACNFNPDALVDDGSCTLAGCNDSYACNFDAEVACDDGSCDYSCCPGPGCCDVGMHWDWELGMCQITNLADTNLDGCVQLNDLLDVLSAYGNCTADESVWQCGDPIEYQGYNYETVQIGEQCWFSENLRTAQYANGDSIITNLSGSEWASTGDGAQTVYNNGTDNLVAFGRLYNWYAVNDDRGLCPMGWHVPTDGDWIDLEIALGMDAEEVTNGGWRGTDQGDQLKSSPEDNPIWDGNNSAGFSALPGGLVSNHMGSYSLLQSYGCYWSSSLVGLESLVWTRRFTTGASTILRPSQHVRYGFSVRCVRDAE